MRDNVKAGGVHALIAIHVVDVPVRVDQGVGRIAADCGDGLAKMGNGCREAGIDQKNAVFAGLDGHVAARALQQPDVVVELRGLDRRRGSGCVHLCKAVRRRCGCRSLGKNPAWCKRRCTSGHAETQKTSAVDLKCHLDPLNSKQ